MAYSAVWLFLRQGRFELTYSLELLDEATTVSQLAAEQIVLNSNLFYSSRDIDEGLLLGQLRSVFVVFSWLRWYQ